MTRTVRFGIIGCGMIGHWHAQALQSLPDVELVGAADGIPEFAAKFAARYGIRAFASSDEMFASDAVDAVCICTPSGLHAALGLQACNAGKHVVVEKPLALSLLDADALIHAAESNRVQVAVISQLRFSPAVQRLKAAVEEGRLGRLVMADLTMEYNRTQEYYDQSGWRGTWAMDGGGALMNQGIHGIDLLQYVMGPVKSVSARIATLVRSIEVEDTAAAVLEFANGALGTVQATTSVYPGYPRRLGIHGDRGSIVLEEDALIVWDLAEPGDEPPPLLGPTANGSANDPGAFGIEGHARQLADMADAIRSDRKPLVDAVEGRKAVEIILAAYESSKSQRPVELDATGTARPREEKARGTGS